MLPKVLLLAGIALPAQILGLVVHEALEGVPAGWTKVGEPSDDHPIKLEVALQMSNIDKVSVVTYDINKSCG